MSEHSNAPYALERMLISPSGRKKGILKLGERKNLKTDKVVLVRGKRNEVENVRRIFHLCADERKTCPQIAEQLNSEHLTFRGKPWDSNRVIQILKRREYLGLNVWARRAMNIYGPSSLRPQVSWVTSKAPFKALIDEATFDKAQEILASHRVSYTTVALVRHLTRLWKRNGRLNSNIIDRTQPASSTYRKRFGSLLKAYQQIGFRPSSTRFAMSEHYCDHRTLHNKVLRTLQEQFPLEVRIVRLSGRQRGSVEVDGQYNVSVFICGKPKRISRGGQRAWLLRLPEKDKQSMALICTLDSQWKNIIGYYLLRPLGDSIKGSRCFYENHPWLIRSGQRLKDDLTDFCEGVRILALAGSECGRSWARSV